MLKRRTPFQLHNKLIDNISSDNSLIDWKQLEKELEKQDKQSASYYGGDDLSFEAVLKAARVSAKEAE
jgi:hypothetical protein